MSELSVCELDTQCGELLPERQTLGTLNLSVNVSVNPTTAVSTQVGQNIAVLSNGIIQSVSQATGISA